MPLLAPLLGAHFLCNSELLFIEREYYSAFFSSCSFPRAVFLLRAEITDYLTEENSSAIKKLRGADPK